MSMQAQKCVKDDVVFEELEDALQDKSWGVAQKVLLETLGTPHAEEDGKFYWSALSETGEICSSLELARQDGDKADLASLSNAKSNGKYFDQCLKEVRKVCN
jgi:hypothetical protein